MSNSVELPKLPVVADIQTGTPERESLPFSSTPLTQDARAERAGQAAAAAKASDFEAYLNRRNILKLPLYRKKTFDTAAEILRRSVYKPIKVKSEH
jgi:hypothetical protein